MLAAFVAQFYDDKPPPPLVLLSHELPEQDLVAEALGLQARVRGRQAGRDRGAEARREMRRGAHARDQCARGAGAQLAETRGTGEAAGRRRRSCSGCSAPPERIEVYDNSHIMGANAVRRDDRGRAGGVRQAGLPEVRHPRADGARRRFRDDARGAGAPLRPGAEGEPGPVPSTPPGWPDLVLIDGGAGQLSAARGDAGRSGRERSAAGGHRQGAGPRRRAGMVPRRRPGGRSSCRRATRCCISCSGCATRRTASPSPRTAPAAARRW